MSAPRPSLRVRLTSALVAVVAALGLTMTPAVATAAVEFTGVGAPSISGTGIVGSTFTASYDASTTSPTPTSVDYDWYRVDTGALVQEGGSTLVASQALLGTGVYVLATLREPSTPSYRTTNSPFSATVRLGEFAGVRAPSISGSGIVGSSFTASYDASGTTPAPTTVAFDWYRYDTGALVQEGGSTFVATEALLGVGVYVLATLSAPGVQDYRTINSPFSATVRLGEFTGVGAPSIAGSGVVGSTFTASYDASGTTPTPTSVTFDWYRVDTGALVQEGGATLVATEALLGTGVYVLATLSAPDALDVVTTNSPFSAAVRLGEFSSVGTPVVEGSGVVGTTLGVALDTSDTVPAPTTVRFTWYRVDTGAEVLDDADSLLVTSELLGTPVYVVATLEAPGTQSYVTANSAFSATVHLRSFVPGDAPTLGGRNVLGGVLTASIDLATWTPEPTAVAWQWRLEDGTPIAGATSAQLAMTADLAGEVVFAEATLSAPDTQPYVVATAPSGRIAVPGIAIDGSSRVLPGATVSVEAWGLLLDTEYALELRSTPLALGTAVSTAEGTIDAQVTIPTTAEIGAHRLALLLDGQEVASVPLEVVAAAPAPVAPQPGAAVPAAPSALPQTGAADASVPAALAALLLVLGVTLVLRRRPA
ncbi:LPXTG cell wall anchor domain-containing protein [Agrococcus sp. SGAir0287]|uniref:LPXTG cell wall anchor domain-containing protein n=1 Tax=Agrococcus sp. SGAir0287 TaxID=2070347 RepID=UPI0010CD22C6|nr:LPXTG cell wall anchor domain-containing protein [Agrococcus sp. SGAir0287]QCR20314.1 hypothetical protein C1N71_13405 [Agrococcus sp. SGAir0287]